MYNLILFDLYSFIFIFQFMHNKNLSSITNQHIIAKYNKFLPCEYCQGQKFYYCMEKSCAFGQYLCCPCEKEKKSNSIHFLHQMLNTRYLYIDRNKMGEDELLWRFKSIVIHIQQTQSEMKAQIQKLQNELDKRNKQLQSLTEQIAKIEIYILKLQSDKKQRINKLRQINEIMLLEESILQTIPRIEELKEYSINIIDGLGVFVQIFLLLDQLQNQKIKEIVTKLDTNITEHIEELEQLDLEINPILSLLCKDMPDVAENHIYRNCRFSTATSNDQIKQKKKESGLIIQFFHYSRDDFIKWSIIPENIKYLEIHAQSTRTISQSIQYLLYTNVSRIIIPKCYVHDQQQIKQIYGYLLKHRIRIFQSNFSSEWSKKHYQRFNIAIYQIYALHKTNFRKHQKMFILELLEYI